MTTTTPDVEVGYDNDMMEEGGAIDTVTTDAGGADTINNALEDTPTFPLQGGEEIQGVQTCGTLQSSPFSQTGGGNCNLRNASGGGLKKRKTGKRKTVKSRKVKRKTGKRKKLKRKTGKRKKLKRKTGKRKH
tara:strand:+ start:1401 stop:1796 length:396 start_codon:yes stop_codon:yes gene_type:complete